LKAPLYVLVTFASLTTKYHGYKKATDPKGVGGL
jgi:hypothetical protein